MASIIPALNPPRTPPPRKNPIPLAAQQRLLRRLLARRHFLPHLLPHSPSFPGALEQLPEVRHLAALERRRVSKPSTPPGRPPPRLLCHLLYHPPPRFTLSPPTTPDCPVNRKNPFCQSPIMHLGQRLEGARPRVSRRPGMAAQMRKGPHFRRNDAPTKRNLSRVFRNCFHGFIGGIRFSSKPLHLPPTSKPNIPAPRRRFPCPDTRAAPPAPPATSSARCPA